MAQTIKLSTLKKNPDNPRLLKDKGFRKLLKNILRYPKFLEQRPMVHLDNLVIGGNMRLGILDHIVGLKANDFNKLAEETNITQDLFNFWQDVRKTKAIPARWVSDAAGYTEEEIKAFIIIDNRDFGEDDMDKLANEWDVAQLSDWGVNTEKWELPTEETKQVTFNVTKRDENYVTFEQVMHVTNKTRLTNLLDKVRTAKKLDKLEDALMEIADYYEKHHKLE